MPWRRKLTSRTRRKPTTFLVSYHLYNCEQIVHRWLRRRGQGSTAVANTSVSELTLRIHDGGSLKKGLISMPVVAPAQKLLKTRNAAIYLNVSQWRIRQMAHKGQIPYVQ